MKHLLSTLISAALLIVLPYNLAAQESDASTAPTESPKPAEVRVKESTTPLNNLRISYGLPGFIPILMLESWDEPSSEPYDPTMSESIHQARSYWGKERMMAMLSAEYTHTLKPWFSIGCKASFGVRWRNQRDMISDKIVGHDNTYATSMLLSMRFDWLRRPYFGLYSGLAVGAATTINDGGWYAIPMYDATYIGMSVGKSFYGFFELGGGMCGILRLGVGYKF